MAVVLLLNVFVTVTDTVVPEKTVLAVWYVLLIINGIAPAEVPATQETDEDLLER